MKRFCLLILCAILFTEGYSQISLPECEAKLVALFDTLKTRPSMEICHSINIQIEQELSQALVNPLSFDYSFDSLLYLGKIYSDDKLLRIYTWNIAFEDGTYTYGGLVQQKAENIVTVLKIKESAYKPPTNKQIKSNDWYGALYYQAIVVNHKRTSYYVLLGWAGNNDLTTYKLIDILSVSDKTGVNFGLNVLNNQNKSFSRVVFEYGSQYKMTLDYDSKKKQIVFDHLSPSSSKYEGVYSHYGPDFSYDSYQLNKNDWDLKENIDVRNKE